MTEIEAGAFIAEIHEPIGSRLFSAWVDSTADGRESINALFVSEFAAGTVAAEGGDGSDSLPLAAENVIQFPQPDEIEPVPA